ncbi:unnamed protein product [Vitrella brassicaformis CCMP3155]|uniref:Peptidase S74 domain-containing protein n=1 Tax=Vitrella brassicaformis (strain CCMP3155) TaxID=1169540 RepID=A0A0G4H582_VITBC|nr:unnamed protein product [Vitrella brassicaformis CCMP3155]|eukprot:CEM38770.1 unnamed protein product [Vitrella brassicaformis CCMP3155]
MAFTRFSRVVVLCLALTVAHLIPCGHADCEPDVPGSCPRIIAGNPTGYDPDNYYDGNLYAAGSVFADRAVFAKGSIYSDDDVTAPDDVYALEDVIAFRDVEAFGTVRGRNIITAGFVFVERGVTASENVVAFKDVIAIENVFATRNLTAGDALFADRIILGDADTRYPGWRYEVRAGDIFTNGVVTAREFRANSGLTAGVCRCGDETFSRRVIAGEAVEVQSSDLPTADSQTAEWGEGQRSAAYVDAFRQLPVHSYQDARLGLVADEVRRLLPSAVRTFAKHEIDGERRRSEATEAPEEAEGEDNEADEQMTIDLTQLVFTQMAVIQDLIDEKEQMGERIEGLTKTIEAIVGRIARLEDGSGGDGPTGPH